MYITSSIWWFFHDIIEGMNIKYKDVYDDYKRKDNELYVKFRIKSGDIDIQNFNKIISDYNGASFERGNGDIYAEITNIKAVIKIRNGTTYIIISIIINQMGDL